MSKMSDKLLPLVAVILPVTIFCFIVAVSYYCGRASAKQEQTTVALFERTDYWRLKAAMAIVNIEDIVESSKNMVEIKWMAPSKWIKPKEVAEQLDRGNR